MPLSVIFWGALAIAALWWPGTVSGPLDGAPLDGTIEAIGLGLLLPALWWFHGEFLQSRLARVAIAAIVIVKIAGAFLTQEGWCSSVLMVLTMNDPARFAWYAIPLLAAGIISLAAVIGIKFMRDLPLPFVLFVLAGCSSALVARGVAYSGRFSTILIGAGSAITVCAIARIADAWRMRRAEVPS